jgi:hypothetical protein
MKIDYDNYKKVADKLIEYFVIKQCIPYFNITYVEDYSMSNCFFTPATRGNLFVSDYEKILRILLDHPKLKDLELCEEENEIYVHCIYEEYIKRCLK